ncbi:phenylalanyl-tRNA synthetase subunit beta [Moorella thermoacetica]|nr:phenylalanyl-tRNA synthetase subunit beta [Moorella thermoacetica]
MTPQGISRREVSTRRATKGIAPTDRGTIDAVVPIKVPTTSRLMQINSLVDSYNYISLKYALALGAHDLDKVEGKIAFNLTTGKERFHPLGATGPVPVSPGEYAYMDAREILCRLEVKQCEKTKITPETTNAFFIIQGNAATPMDYLYRAADELMGLIATYCQGQVSMAAIEYTGSE